MKKSHLIPLLSLVTLTLTSCNFGLSIFSGLFDDSSSSSYDYSSDTLSAESYTHAEPTAAKSGQVVGGYTYNDVIKNNLYDLSSAPNSGDVRLLIVPVWFTDSSSYILSSRKDYVREDIRKAYFGTENETGWHSVRTYYEKESMGRVRLDGTVTDWYACERRSTSFYSERDGADATMDLATAAANWYFANHPSDPRTNYDSDADGYIDGIMLIYGAPDYSAMRKDNASNMWAYCYWVQDATAQNTSRPGVNVYFWASYDFMYGHNAIYKAGSSYGSGDTDHCKVDAHTYIHEMGHVFGLDDYYDYGDNSYAPAGSFSMQDANRGGHDPFSVFAFGWADPYVVGESTTITIGSFQKEHDVVLLTPSWNEYDSPFDEYLLVELFTPSGLNQLDCTYAYNGSLRGPTQTGIRLWHVDARLAMCTNYNEYTQNLVYSKSLTSDPTDSRATYGVTTAFTNSYDSDDYGSVLGSSYDKYDLLHLIRNDTRIGYRTSEDIGNSDLFKAGDSFSMSTYRSQFPNSTNLNSGVALGWTFTVNSISGSGDDATATITFTKA